MRFCAPDGPRLLVKSPEGCWLTDETGTICSPILPNPFEVLIWVWRETDWWVPGMPKWASAAGREHWRSVP